MKKNDFQNIIKLIKPSFTGIQFGKTWYKAFIYVVPFTVKDVEYKLYVDLVQDCAFIKDTIKEKEVGSIDINNRKFLKILQGA